MIKTTTAASPDQPIVDPTTIDQVKETKRYAICTTRAQGYLAAVAALPEQNDGRITDTKIIFDKKTNRLVYAFYRIKNKENRFYVIF